MAHELLERKHEVIVAGGGLVGWAAAMTAARAGRQTLLVSRRPQLGWEITAALCQTLDAEAGGLAREIADRLAARGAARDGLVAPPAVELLLDEMAGETDMLDLLLYATPVAPVVADDRVCGVLVAAKDGQHVLRADLVVDATDTLLVARQTGLPLELREQVPSRVTLVFDQPGHGLAKCRPLSDCPPARNVTVSPSVFAGELRVQYDVPSASPLEAQLAAPAVLAQVRQEVPELAGALVTVTSAEPLPIDARVWATGDLDARAGLVVAGPVAEPEEDRRCCGCPSGRRLALGEASGRAAAERWTPVETGPAPEPGTLLPAPPHESCDVLVAGGGTGGSLAAIAAARQGAATTLVEPAGYLGGIGTGGGIYMYYHGISGGLQDEVDELVHELTPLFAGGSATGGVVARRKGYFHPEAKKIALAKLAAEAGVRLLFGATATGVRTEEVSSDAAGGTPARTGAASRPTVRLRSVLAADAEGMHVIDAKAFVDATGDGDLAAMAGAEFVMGRDGDGLLHAFSQSAGLLREPDPEETPPPADDALPPPRRMAVLNFDAGFVDPDDVTDLTRARRLGLRWLRRDAWTDEDRLTMITPHLGLRQGRQIVGDYQLTLGDEVAGARFPDAVAYAWSHYDNHARDYENESDAGAVWVWLLGQWRRQFGCEIPYRSLLPRGVEGLVIGCRALSLTQDAHYQLRMQRDMQRIGEAAGIAAALAARGDTTPRGIDVAELQDRLRQVGALRDEDRPRPALPEKPVGELVEQLGSDDPRDAVWELAVRHRDAVDAVRGAMESGPPARRFYAAATLAMAGDTAAVPELIQAVNERREDVLEGRLAAPAWQNAVVLLGRLGDASAVPAVAGVLAQDDLTLHQAVAAIRSLGRIGDAEGADAVRAAVRRDDIETMRTLQVSMGLDVASTEDARWQLDLAAAEALARMGRPDVSLAEPYLDDERAYVRRYARRVVEASKAAARS